VPWRLGAANAPVVAAAVGCLYSIAGDAVAAAAVASAADELEHAAWMLTRAEQSHVAGVGSWKAESTFAFAVVAVGLACVGAELKAGLTDAVAWD
jgi:hypothetical protein